MGIVWDAPYRESSRIDLSSSNAGWQQHFNGYETILEGPDSVITRLTVPAAITPRVGVAVINAYFVGLRQGRDNGRVELQSALRRLLDISLP